VLVTGDVKLGEDECRLDFEDPARSQARDLAELVSGVQVHHVTDRAGRFLQPTGTSERVECLERQYRQQALNRAVKVDPPVVRV